MAEDEKMTGVLGGSGRGCRVAPIAATFGDNMPALGGVPIVPAIGGWPIAKTAE